MRLHANAALGLAGRRKLVGLIEQGHSLRAAAAALGVCPATAHRWWHRWARAGAPQRAGGACLADRSSAPHRQPRRLSDAQEAPILAARQATNLGPGRLAHIVGRARSTIYKVLARHGLSRRRSGPRPVAHGRRGLQDRDLCPDTRAAAERAGTLRRARSARNGRRPISTAFLSHWS